MADLMEPVVVSTSSVAKKKFVGLLDEYSRRLNPWSLVPTYGVADISDLSKVRDQFRTYGIVVIRRVYDEPETAQFYQTGKDFTGLNDLDVVRVATRETKHFVGGTPAVVEPKFWPFITHRNVKAVVREIYQSASVVEIGTSMAAHYSARGLHRDFPTWFQDPKNSYNLENGVCTVLRILTYPTRPGMPAGTFGFIPFSHRKDLYERHSQRVGLRRPFEWYDEHRQLARRAVADGTSAELEEMDSLIVWVHLEAGDILLLDARMQHAGDFITGPRYLFVMSFAMEDAKSKTLLRKRWSTQLQQQEFAYYKHLYGEGLCGAELLEECRAAASQYERTGLIEK